MLDISRNEKIWKARINGMPAHKVGRLNRIRKSLWNTIYEYAWMLRHHIYHSIQLEAKFKLTSTNGLILSDAYVVGTCMHTEKQETIAMLLIVIIMQTINWFHWKHIASDHWVSEKAWREKKTPFLSKQ